MLAFLRLIEFELDSAKLDLDVMLLIPGSKFALSLPMLIETYGVGLWILVLGLSLAYRKDGTRAPEV